MPLAKEAVRANFSKDKGRSNPEDMDKGNQVHRGWNKKNHKHRYIDFVVVADPTNKQKTNPTPTRIVASLRNSWMGHA